MNACADSILESESEKEKMQARKVMLGGVSGMKWGGRVWPRTSAAARRSCLSWGTQGCDVSSWACTFPMNQPKGT
jgi:hypothetical protein